MIIEMADILYNRPILLNHKSLQNNYVMLCYVTAL